MSIAFVQRVDSGNNGSGSGSSSTVSITPTAGSVLIIGFHQAGSNALSSVTDNNGTPQSIVSGINNSLSSGMYFVPNAAAVAHSITVTFGSTGWTDLWVAEYSGADPNSPIDAFGYGHGASGVSPSTNVTTNGANRMLVSYVHAEGTSLAVGSGFTSRDTFDSNQVQDQAAASPGTFAAGSPTSALGNWLSLVAAIRINVASSVTDSRVAKPSSATSRTVQGTLIYDVQTSSNSTVPATDSRASGAPVDSRVAAIIPQNSRAALG